MDSLQSEIEMLFFEPQTGLFKRYDWISNYYHFRLRNSHTTTNQHTVDWLEENIERATVGSSGLEYAKGFLKGIETFEKASDASIKRLLRLSLKYRGRVPQKIGC